MTTAHIPVNQGEKNSHAKLTEADVVLLRQCHAKAKRLREEAAQLGLEALALKFDVSKQTVYDVVTGQTWRHVPFPEEGR